MHIYFQNMQIQLTDIDVAIIFKATYARFEKEKNYFMVSSRTLPKILFTRNMLWTVFMNTLKPG